MAGRSERVKLRDEQLGRRPGARPQRARLDAAGFVAPAVCRARPRGRCGVHRCRTAEQHRSHRRDQEPGNVADHPSQGTRARPEIPEIHGPTGARAVKRVQAAGASVCYRPCGDGSCAPELGAPAWRSQACSLSRAAVPRRRNRINPMLSASPTPTAGCLRADARRARVRGFRTRRWRRRQPSPTPWRLRTPSWPNAAPVSLDCFLSALKQSADGARRRQHVQPASFGRRGAEPARVHLFGQPGHVGGARRRRQPLRRAGRVHEPRPVDQGPARVSGDGTPVALADAYESIRTGGGTLCGGCHRDEQPAPQVTDAQAFESGVLAPRPSDVVPVRTDAGRPNDLRPSNRAGPLRDPERALRTRPRGHRRLFARRDDHLRLKLSPIRYQPRRARSSAAIWVAMI